MYLAVRIRLISLVFAALAVLGLGTSGCHREDHDADAGHHAHQPKNGGQLVEVGQHQFNLELLADPASGRLTVWVLDAHADDYVRISAKSLELSIISGGADRPVSAVAVANPASGETVGDTSQFEATADWLKSDSKPNFSGTVRSLVIRGRDFGGLTFQYPSESHASGH